MLPTYQGLKVINRPWLPKNFQLEIGITGQLADQLNFYTLFEKAHTEKVAKKNQNFMKQVFSVEFTKAAALTSSDA